jgi:phage/plasmid-like protein (TIGR03299 family)
MAHEIDFSKGYAAMFAVRVPVWHQSETGAKRLAYHPTVEAALIEAGLDFIVEKVPTKRLMADGRLLDNALAFSTVRQDTGAELGMVGRDYTPLQNLDALRIFQPLIDSGHCVIETAGALRGGADVWVAVAWNIEKFGEQARALMLGDPRGLLPYSVIRNNHNGRSNVVGMDVTICPVCANTLGFALTEAGVSESEGREGRVSGNAFAAWRIEEPAEIEALAVAFRAEGDRRARTYGCTEVDGRFWQQIADRILAGAMLTEAGV